MRATPSPSRPLGGANAYGTPFKPQRGEQWEAGVKWQPPGQGINAFAAVYQLREKNRKTTDPTQPAQQPSDRRGQGQRF